MILAIWLLLLNLGTANALEEQVHAPVQESAIELARLSSQLDALTTEVRLLRSTFEAQMLKVDAVLTKTTVAPVGATDEAVQITKEQRDFKRSYQFVLAKDYKKAKQAIANFSDQYPDSQYMPNIHYWLGEIYLLEHNYPLAHQHFSEVINNYPSSAKLGLSMLKLASVLNSLEKPEVAKKQLQLVIEQYPDSALAMLARKQLMQQQ